MTFELTILGSSSALPTSTKFPTAQVLNVHERFFLIDCGEGTQVQLRKARISIGKINHIFISHLHGDHVFGLFGLLSSCSLLGRKNTLHIYGHSDLDKIINFYLERFSPENPFKIEIHHVVKRDIQLIYDDRVVNVFAFPLKHRVPTFGFLFREKERLRNVQKQAIERYHPSIQQIREIKEGKDLITSDGHLIPNEQLTIDPYRARSYAFCSDTAVYQRIIPWIKNADLLYHEATFLHRDKSLAKLTAHSTAVQAAKIASAAEVGKLLIGHFSSRYKNEEELLGEAREIMPGSEIAEELKTYTVPLKR